MPEIEEKKEDNSKQKFSFTELRQIFQNAGFKILKRILQSFDFVSGSTGWRLTASGDFEANEGTFRGALKANSIDIPDTTAVGSFHTNNTGNSWWGNSAIGSALAYILNTGYALFKNLTVSTVLQLGVYTVANLPSNTSTFSTKSPATIADDSAVGSIAWIDSTLPYAKVSDNYYAVAVLGSSITENRISIVKADGSVGSTNKSTGASLPAGGAESYVSYGGASDLWGESWTDTDINDADFGAVFSGVGSLGTSHYLKATNFGFAIPSGATINGILVEIEQRATVNQLVVDHFRITVYYTISGGVSAGAIAYASNGRKNGEGVGAGTGVMAFYDGTAWRACDTGATVAA